MLNSYEFNILKGDDSLIKFENVSKTYDKKKYVLNNLGDKEWNEWLKKAESLGYKELVKVYNDAQKRFDSK